MTGKWWRRARGTVASGNDIPKKAVEAAGLRPGDELRAEAVGPDEIRFARVYDPLEGLDELVHEFAGMDPPGYLDELRNEWDSP